MRRQLTAREWLLLGVLGLLVLVSGYLLLFYNPMTEERDRCIAETETCRLEIDAATIRLKQKLQMEKELEEIFAAETPPLSIPDYDNLKPVMFELNSTLAGAQNYSLSFAEIETSGNIVSRSIAMTFTAGSYEAAKAVLRELDDSDYRCLLNDLNISLGNSQGTAVVGGNIIFFEYLTEPLAAGEN